MVYIYSKTVKGYSHITSNMVCQDYSEKYYDKDVYGQVKASHILITPSVSEDASTDEKEEIVDAFKVKAIDTTGAGDAFNGGFLCALSEGKDIWEAARFANALAALSVQKIGTTVSMPTREEIEQFLEQN